MYSTYPNVFFIFILIYLYSNRSLTIGQLLSIFHKLATIATFTHEAPLQEFHLDEVTHELHSLAIVSPFVELYMTIVDTHSQEITIWWSQSSKPSQNTFNIFDHQIVERLCMLLTKLPCSLQDHFYKVIIYARVRGALWAKRTFNDDSTLMVFVLTALSVQHLTILSQKAQKIMEEIRHDPYTVVYRLS